jgi:hypothetical protein
MGLFPATPSVSYYAVFWCKYESRATLHKSDPGLCQGLDMFVNDRWVRQFLELVGICNRKSGRLDHLRNPVCG